MKRSGHLVSLIVVSIQQGFQGLVFRNLTSTGIKNEEVTHEHAYCLLLFMRQEK